MGCERRFGRTDWVGGLAWGEHYLLDTLHVALCLLVHDAESGYYNEWKVNQKSCWMMMQRKGHVRILLFVINDFCVARKNACFEIIKNMDL